MEDSNRKISNTVVENSEELNQVISDIDENIFDSTTDEFFPNEQNEDREAATGPYFKVVLIRSGEATSNETFCGWCDLSLSDNGRRSILEAGNILKRENYVFDIAYCSALSRSKETLSIILNELGLNDIPIISSWYLNGRHIGALTGMNKSEITAKYGIEQVNYWLYDSKFSLPAMDSNHRYYNSIYNNEMYAQCTGLPTAETLEKVKERVVQYWNKEICPNILSGKKIIIVSHNKALQALIQYLDDLDYSAFIDVSLPEAMPFYYKFDETLKPIFTKYDLLE